jgi:predicted Zn-dependent protease
VNERSYLKRLDGLVYGDDPRNGYLDGDVFVDPAHGVQLELPAGWKRQIGRFQVVTVNAAQNAGLQTAVTTGNSDARTPAERVQAAIAAGNITSADGRSETLAGHGAWSGVVIVPADAGPQRMLLTLVKLSDTAMLQMSGRSTAAGDPDEQAIRASMRSLRPVEATRRAPAVSRVAVSPAPKRGTFQSVVEGFGSQAIGLDDTAILNDRYPDQDVMAGELVKVVRRSDGR